MRHGLISALCLGTAMVLAFPAFADIKAFNAAVSAGDYKAATVEAARTWPQLDKSRADIHVIAHEFGYAAYMNGDYAAMKTYAEFAASHPATAADASLAATAGVLLRLAEHRLKPGDKTRDQLMAALNQRASLPGFDNISYFGIDTLVSHDIGALKWKDAQASTALALKMMTAGGSYYAVPKRRFELLSSVSDYLAIRTPTAYARLKELQDQVVADVDKAPSDDAARPLVPIYWDIATWRMALGNHLIARGKKLPYGEPEEPQQQSERYVRLFSSYPGCSAEPVFERKLEYPYDALDRGFVGAVTLELDIDKEGRAINPRVLSAVPRNAFVGEILKATKGLTFKPGEKWDAATCKLERTNHHMQFEFSLRRG
jgi:TonB family protein